MSLLSKRVKSDIVPRESGFRKRYGEKEKHKTVDFKSIILSKAILLEMFAR